MRSLLFHCKDFNSIITGLSTRPANIICADVFEKKQSSFDCILVFITIEKSDDKKSASKLAQEIIKFCQDTKHNNVFLCPFVHLSNNLASSKKARAVFDQIVSKLKTPEINLTEGHFGSDKELLIQVYGHPGNARYREF